jgi:murein endopeptidase
VHLLREATRLYGRMVRGGPNIHIGDISKREGGPFPPHISHQAGRDVDIGYVLRGQQADNTRFLPAVAGNIDRERTWALLEALMATDGVSYIFMDYDVQKLLYEHARAKGVEPQRLRELFQYPAGRYAWSGKIRHWRGHGDHFHVRFRAG